MNQLTETEKAYIAGLIDGEGCFNVSKQSHPRARKGFKITCRLLVVNTDASMMLWLLKTIGAGSIYTNEKIFNPKWKPVHRYYINGQQAVELTRLIVPYLQIKKKQAELLLSFPANYKNRCGLTDEQYTIQDKTYFQMKSLNKRGLTVTE